MPIKRVTRGIESVLGQWDTTVRRRVAPWRSLTPPQLLALSFATLILLGTLALLFLPGLYTGPGLTVTQAVFTATSAVCVTGLIVVDTATYFTPAGQVLLLVLIQLGGLGIITFSTLIIVAFGERLSFRHEAIVRTSAGSAAYIDGRRLAGDVIRFTLGLEALGAILLYVQWVPRFGLAGAIWPSIFHAISAFCNAGFSTFSDSLMGFQQSPVTLMTVSLLVVAGGLGFFTLRELRERRIDPVLRRRRMSLHARIVLTTTAILLVGGAILCTTLEWNGTLAGLGLADRLSNGLFMSVTARTAGFNSVDYGAVGEGANFGTILLMFVGGSPGSTAGGIKTTTFALVGLLAWSRFRGRRTTDVAERTIPDDTIEAATGITAIAFGVVTVGILVLLLTEGSGAGFLPFMFEAASAFNTVGLSMGLTASMSQAGEIVLILLMFTGRVGVLTLAAALARPRRRGSAVVRYAREDVAVG